MGLGNRIARVEDVIDRFGDWKRTPFGHDGRKVLPLEVLHDDVRPAHRGLAHVNHTCDVLAPEPRRRASLLEKPRDDLSIGKRLRPDDLDGDELLELEVRGGEYDPHASLADNPFDAKLVRDDLSRTHEDVSASHGNLRNGSPRSHESRAPFHPSIEHP